MFAHSVYLYEETTQYELSERSLTTKGKVPTYIIIYFDIIFFNVD